MGPGVKGTAPVTAHHQKSLAHQPVELPQPSELAYPNTQPRTTFPLDLPNCVGHYHPGPDDQHSREPTGSKPALTHHRLTVPSSAPSFRCFLHPQNSTRSEEHTSELQSRGHLVCRLLLEKKKHNV